MDPMEGCVKGEKFHHEVVPKQTTNGAKAIGALQALE
jgi:hypothetical protein